VDQEVMEMVLVKLGILLAIIHMFCVDGSSLIKEDAATVVKT
jgi:hypothetical protein